LILVVIIALFAAVAIPRVNERRHYRADNSCINNLRIIEAGKDQWAMEQHKTKSDTPAGSDLQPYIGRGSSGGLPFCPADPKQTFDTSYSLHNVGIKPTCKIMPGLHVLN
jgi:hypothetical protein